MSDIITTLHKKGDSSVNLYPNIKADNIPESSIDASKIEDGAITERAIYNASVTGSKIAYKTITNTNIADNTITADKMNFHLYEHRYTMRLTTSNNSIQVRFAFSFLSSLDTAITDVTLLADMLASKIPNTLVNNYYSNYGFNRGNDTAVYLYNMGNDFLYEVTDDLDESINFNASTESFIVSSKVNLLF